MINNLVSYRNDGGGFSPFLDAHSRAYRVFLEPNTGGGAGGAPSGGTAGNGAAGGTPPVETTQPAGGAAAAAAGATPESPWNNIPWDELAPDVRRVMEAARTDHQRLAGENATLLEQNRVATQQRQQQQQQQRQAPAGQQQQPPAPNPIEAKVRETLQAKGYTAAQIDAQAPIFADLLGGILPIFKESVGRDLGPLANSVINHENTQNFEAAMQSPAGQQLFADPQLAQEVWNVVAQQTAAGRTFDSEAILNYAKMQWFDKQTAATPAGQPVTLPSTSTFFPTAPAPVNRSTGFNFPGAVNIRPPGIVGTDPNAPKHASNAETQAALAVTFAELHRTTGVAPKAFPASAARPTIARR